MNKFTNSDRSFGYLLFCIFFIFTFYFKSNNIKGFFLFFLILSILFLLITLFTPKLLSKPKYYWIRMGDLIGKITGPLILAFMFYFLLTPVAFFARLFGRDELRLKKTRTHSYWISRKPSGPDSNSFFNQY